MSHALFHFGHCRGLSGLEHRGSDREPEPDRVCFSTAETREKILAHGLFEPFRVMRNVASRSQAEAIGIKLCRWSEDLVYEMSLLRRDGRVIHVFVNAKTGQVIGSKNEH
ncbi:MAG: PepSY domain-containing protein [Methylocella sp.]